MRLPSPWRWRRGIPSEALPAARRTRFLGFSRDRIDALPHARIRAGAFALARTTSARAEFSRGPSRGRVPPRRTLRRTRTRRRGLPFLRLAAVSVGARRLL